MDDFKPTHYGSLYGFPIWIDMTDEDCPAIKAKFGKFGDIIFDIIEGLASIYISIMQSIDPMWEPTYTITIKGEVDETKTTD